MAAESIKKELSGILERLNTLSPNEKSNLLVFFKGLLPQTLLDAHTSDQQPDQSSSNVEPIEELASANPWGLSENALSLLNDVGDSYNFPCSVQTQDKCVNVPEEGAQVPTSGKEPFEPSSTNEPTKSPTETQPPNRIPCLHCPICREEFTTWPDMEKHLYGSHVTSVAPVCWRCQGVFANHSLLLAHECFDWGRLNLPCQAVMDGSSVAASRRRAILRNSSHLDYPADGVFLKRRCGLCFKSTTLFADYHSFRRHKDSEHPSESISASARVHRGKRKGSTLDLEEEVSHPQTVEALRATLHRLLSRFQAQPKEARGNRRRYRKPLLRSNLKKSAPLLTPRLITSDYSSSCPRPDSTTDTNPDAPSTADTNESVQTNPANVPNLCFSVSGSWRSATLYSTSNSSLAKRLRLHRKRAPGVNAARDSSYLRRSRHENPYTKSFGMINGRFACKCCSAVFRVSSRLRAHYLFKHGHIPQSLGGLSPTVEEAAATLRTGMVRSAASHQSRACTRQSNRFTKHESKRQVPGAVNSDCTAEQSVVYSDPLISSTTDTLDDPTRLLSTPESNTQTGVLPENHPSPTDPSADDAATVEANDLTDSIFPHGEPTGPPYKCHFCTQTYAALFSLRRHYIQVHVGEYRFNCGYCEFKTNERCALDEHLARHFGLKQFVCEFCGAGFTVVRELHDHLAFKHNAERKFTCSVCERSFKTAGTLSRHKKIHGTRVLQQCDLCDQKFTRLSNLKRHLQRSHQPKVDTAPPVAPDLPKKRGIRTQKDVPAQRLSDTLQYPLVGEANPPGTTLDTNSLTLTKPTQSIQRFSVENHIGSTFAPETHCDSRPSNAGVCGTLPAVSTVFRPYVSSQSLSEASRIDSAMTQTSDNPQTTNRSSSYQTMMFHSLIPVHLPPNLITSTDSTETVPWSYPSQNIESGVCYVLNTTASTSTSTPTCTHLVTSTESNMANNSEQLNIITLTGDDHHSPSTSELCEAFEASHHHTSQDSSFNCASYQPAISSRIDTTPAPNAIDSINLEHIWRPVACDLYSVQNSTTSTTVLNSSSTLPLPLLSPLCSESDNRPDALDDQGPTDPNAKGLARCSPRFPSPVSCTLSPRINVYADSPLPQTHFSVYDSAETTRCSAPFLPTHASSSQTTFSNPPHTNSMEGGVLTNQSFDNQSNLPMHLLVCDSANSSHPHFLPPIWNCTSHLDAIHPYSTTVISPNEHPSSSDMDPHCSNFSVGYLIGQNPSNASERADQIGDCSVPTSSTTSAHYFSYDQSTS